MNINITLIIQACNFFIAYVLIRFLLFRPVFALIKKEWEERDSLKDQITNSKKAIEDKLLMSDKQWGMYKKYFSTHAPRIEYLSHEFKDVDPVAEPGLSEDKMRVFENEITRTLVEKVDHVR